MSKQQVNDLRAATAAALAEQVRATAGEPEAGELSELELVAGGGSGAS